MYRGSWTEKDQRYTIRDPRLFATVAQLVEQRPLKPKVLGSIPSRRTKIGLNCSEDEFKRTAQSADQGFSGGIAREFPEWSAQGRKVLFWRRRFEIQCNFCILYKKNLCYNKK